MKNLYLFLLLLFLSTRSFAQTEFAPTGAEWFYESTSGYTTPVHAFSGFTHLKYDGDTLLDGILCKKICTGLFVRESDPAAACDAFRFVFQKADSIFEYQPAASVDKARFLFRNHYEPGDPVADFFGVSLTVQSVDTMEYNGRQVYRYWVGTPQEPQRGAVYSQFGPAKGLFNPDPWDFVVDDGNSDLRCYEDGAFPRVSLTNGPCDEVKFPLAAAFEVFLTPNPVHDELRIYIEGQPVGPVQFSFWDASGRLVLEDASTTYVKKISVGHLSSGVYFGVFRDGQSSFHQKFIKN